jgi:MYXO-CTERM domain-containing protein
MAISGVRVAMGGGVLASSEIYPLAGFNNYPEVAADPAGDRYLAVSWINTGNPDVGGHLVAGDGTPLGADLAVAASSGFEGGDGIGLAFDAASATYLAVYQGPETPGQVQQVWGSPVSADGVPGAAFQVTTASAQNGVYQPRVASDGLGRLLAVTVVDYQRIDGQFVRFDVPADAGTGGSGGAAGDAGIAGSSGSSGGSGSAGSGGTSGTSDDDGGCGCRAAPQTPAGAWLVALALMGALRARRSFARRPRCSR